jgi:hypothetical protein
VLGVLSGRRGWRRGRPGGTGEDMSGTGPNPGGAEDGEAAKERRADPQNEKVPTYLKGNGKYYYRQLSRCSGSRARADAQGPTSSSSASRSSAPTTR